MRKPKKVRKKKALTLEAKILKARKAEKAAGRWHICSVCGDVH